SRASRERLLTADLLVDIYVERLGDFVPYVRGLVIRLPERAGEIRLGQVAENRTRDRADAIGRNDVAREGRPSRAVGIAGQWVVDDRRCGAEVAVAERHRRNRRARS